MKENESIAIISVKSSILGWGMLLTYVIFNSLGAVILKSQIQKLGVWDFSVKYSAFTFFVKLLSYWQTWLGVISITIATGAWIIALAHLELSKAYPVAIGLNLLLIIGMGFIYFNEPIYFSKILGVILILSGVAIVFR